MSGPCARERARQTRRRPRGDSCAAVGVRKDEYGGRIVRQTLAMGNSWRLEPRALLDEDAARPSLEVFNSLYEKGLIYRGNHAWSTGARAATPPFPTRRLEYQEQGGSASGTCSTTVKETGEQLELATTRPETMLGDTAVAINKRPRYAHLHGCHVIPLPLMNVEIRSSATHAGHGKRAPAW